MGKTVFIERLPSAYDLPLPCYTTNESAGMDLYAANDEPIIMRPFERKLIPTGLKIALPKGTEMQIRPRSGLALKYGITVLNTPGTIDSDYRGEIKILLINFGDEPFTIEKGMRIAQAVVVKYEKVKLVESTNLSDTERGSGGFGHTGIK